MLLLCGFASAAMFRETRVAMGTVVGVTVRAPGSERARVSAAIKAAFDSIEGGEAELSEWRPESALSRLAGGERATLSPSGAAFLAWSEALRVGTGGAFDIGWRGGSARWIDAEWRLSGPLDTGGLLKGWLVDLAVAQLREAGLQHFVVDAAGDLYLAGDASALRWGWSVSSEAGLSARVRDAAVSTASQAQQPGHLRDPRGGSVLNEAVTVIATSSARADGLDTAYVVSNGALDPGLGPAWVVVEGVCVALGDTDAPKVRARGMRRACGAQRHSRSEPESSPTAPTAPARPEGGAGGFAG